MGNTAQYDSHPWQRITPMPLAKGVGWGSVAGLAGTLVMDIVLMAGLSAAGLSALTCFSLVGDTVSRFAALLGVRLAAGVPLGAAAHYLIGPAVGALFGAAVVGLRPARVVNLKWCVVAAILYSEIVGLPILATTPILLRMTAAETVQWFGISLAMHVILATVLGVVVWRGLRPAIVAR